METLTPIMQFGTSRFLQAHADLFISEARLAGQDVGPISVVQSSGDAARAGRLQALAVPFPVKIEGLENGVRVEKTVEVGSIARGLSTSNDWADVRRLFVEEVQIVLSNTGDAGYAPQPEDERQTFDQAMSYPAKLTLLLRARFEAGAVPIQIMPMELISGNGEVLKARVMELAKNDSHAFLDYLATGVTWVNSLVDRIVSQPIEPAGAVAEPYALWAIEDQSGLRVPCIHPAVKVVPALAEIEALKLFVLNLGHTVLADRWLTAGGAATVMVRDLMETPSEREHLQSIYTNEVRPGFAAAGQGAAFDDYVSTTLERFANPFLGHAIADIAQNHAMKVERRIEAFLSFARIQSDTSAKPILEHICARQKGA
ncbi:mannitol dehydrogenase family protein [uncultured Ruegeria sp.]|uniref:mannitol dehydrogenase family protein n=1 Tax=uncultured Ruegeria sp. TaxID=259304 RepID=UPI0026379AE5|nr:mannitol dehydrogenase family protein [uncultured Ruegeria sp.]